VIAPGHTETAMVGAVPPEVLVGRGMNLVEA
jgi:hypothetical protein